ncbi:glycosyltransferase [Aliisedimentitalea scapharcae]|uniref:Glycosyltransferase n=1 Tax=Aliisedimentitalea scapharcae TaxID=1524259 RepID=A0ABZ2XWE7_9RHOB
MSEQNLRLLRPTPMELADQPRLPLGRYLVDNGVISQDQLIRALEMQLRLGAPIGELLVAEGWADARDIQFALAQQHGLQQVTLHPRTGDDRLLSTKSAQFWLHHGVVPWMRLGSTVLIATSRPDRFDALLPEFETVFPDVAPVLATETEIAAFVASHFTPDLARAASARVAGKYSCRTWDSRVHRYVGLCLPLLMGVLFWAFPLTLFTIGCILAIFTLCLFTSLKAAGFAMHLATHGFIAAPVSPPPVSNARLPKISVLVPLYKEKAIARALVKRLSRLTYPKSLLDVILVLEEHDHVTRDTLAQTDLPAWMRVIEVPTHNGLTTKPRAMNYALDFCRGDIVGVWDAEDAPTPDQLEMVADRFAHADDDVVCLQGVLDYYNPRSNWLSRCFTIEYSSWFRIVLPGIAHLGLVVPLGGTTLFFKREILEQLGGWDAHNVTEDADLGVRLCRAGYRTELIETATYEEANCRPWPWVKQRSRWLKGFMVTYLVHMRNPIELWQDLGLKRFLGFQAFFLGTLGQFLLAPLLWSFWLILLGLPHPAADMLPPHVLNFGTGVLMLFEVLAIGIGMTAVSSSNRRYLIPWVLTIMAYFPLGVFAAYKALYELIWCPFFWDKTEHGHAGSECETI